MNDMLRAVIRGGAEISFEPRGEINLSQSNLSTYIKERFCTLRNRDRTVVPAKPLVNECRLISFHIAPATLALFIAGMVDSFSIL